MMDGQHLRFDRLAVKNAQFRRSAMLMLVPLSVLTPAGPIHAQAVGAFAVRNWTDAKPIATGSGVALVIGIPVRERLNLEIGYERDGATQAYIANLCSLFPMAWPTECVAEPVRRESRLDIVEAVVAWSPLMTPHFDLAVGLGVGKHRLATEARGIETARTIEWEESNTFPFRDLSHWLTRTAVVLHTSVSWRIPKVEPLWLTIAAKLHAADLQGCVLDGPGHCGALNHRTLRAGVTVRGR